MPAAETKEEIMEIKPEIYSEVDIYDRIESIRVLNPGSYELNIEKLAESDELVVRVGNEEQYVVDILSMSKSKKKRKPNDKPLIFNILSRSTHNNRNRRDACLSLL